LGYSASGDDGEDADELFRRIVDQHPLCRHQLETGEVAAVPARTTTFTYAARVDEHPSYNVQKWRAVWGTNMT
jgi:hypothetical protein